MISLALWQAAVVVALAAASGCIFGMLAIWHPGRPDPAPAGPPGPRTPGPRRAGYLAPGPNAGCYEPDWPAPGDTFSEISAGWDRLERTVITETQPFGRIRP